MKIMSFTELAQTILHDAATLDEYVHANNLPAPSFDVNAPARTPFTTKESINAHAALLANTHKLHHLAHGPAATWMGTMNGGAGDVMTAAAIYHFKIADYVPVNEDASFEEVAQKAGMAPGDFKMVIRYAMTNFIFHEPRPGFIAHTAASRVLKENRLISSLMGMFTNEVFPALVKQIAALEGHPGSEEPTQSGWALANNAKDPIFEELARQHPKRAETLAFAIETLGTMMPDSLIVDNYDWASLGAATIVDVGGGKGLVCKQLAKHFPKLSFVVQDLEDTIVAGRNTLPAEFENRISYMTHDFFTPQPIKDAEVYYFRAIFHNWPDKYCVAILQNLIPALKKGARVVVQDPHTPDPLTMAPWQERQTR
jgi:hypothetical protein